MCSELSIGFSVLSTNGCPWINNLLILIKRDSCLIKAIVRCFLQVNSKNDDELSSKKMMMMMMMPMKGSRRRRRRRRMKSLSRHCFFQ